MYGIRICGIILLWSVLCSCHLEDIGLRKSYTRYNTAPTAKTGTTDTQESKDRMQPDRIEGREGTYTLDINMPSVHPQQDDAYLCTSAVMTSNTRYIINYEAMAVATKAHHILLYGCEMAGSSNSYWGCDRICRDAKQPKILYAWAKNAPPTHLPPDVGYKVGGRTGIKVLVLQIHYRWKIPNTDPGDHSGVHLTLTSTRQKYIAGIFILMRYSLNIPPMTKGVHGDVSCRYIGETPLHPFAFRVHAHSLSTVISAYQNNGTWSLIGKGNPQWPQAFYPVNEELTIKPGDLMFARCTYDSTRRSRNTSIGGSHSDEMCNFYLMYYTEVSDGKPFFACANNDYEAMFDTIPPGNDVPLPPNPALEEDAEASILGAEETVHWPVIMPTDNLTIGQVSGLATDSHGNIHMFHRGSRVWNQDSFDKMNRFQKVSEGAIKENTIVTFSPSGKVIKQWGANMFYMPHGLHIDQEDNLWVTDVALHQVMKFEVGSTTPTLTLGTRLTPGSGDQHFCKPTDVATLKTGEFFITDGYCNHRVIKYTKNATVIKEWGEQTKSVTSDNFPAPYAFANPHSITALEDHSLVCVADRENGRIQCFTFDGVFVKQLHPKEFNGRLFAVSYSPVTGVLYAVNGPDLYNKNVPVLGFSLNPSTGALLETWAPHQGLHNPHGLAISPQGDFIYVGELDPHKIWRLFVSKHYVQEHKYKKGVHPQTRPVSVDGSTDADTDEDVAKEETKGESDLGASMVIGALLVIPVIIIVAVTAFMRLRKSGKFSFLTTLMYKKSRNRRFNLGTFLSRHKGFNRLNTDEGSDHEYDHLNSDSDVEEYSATTRKA